MGNFLLDKRFRDAPFQGQAEPPIEKIEMLESEIVSLKAINAELLEVALEVVDKIKVPSGYATLDGLAERAQAAIEKAKPE